MVEGMVKVVDYLNIIADQLHSYMVSLFRTEKEVVISRGNRTNEKLVDKLIVNGATDCNEHAVRRFYKKRYTDRRVPNHTILASENRRESGSGHVMGLVYETSVPSAEDLIAQISVAAERIRGMPGIFQNKRTAVRSSLTKLINKIEGKINNENEPVDQFEAFIEQLNDKESNLSLLNTLIEDRLSVDTITEDMEASEEIKEKIIFWKTKLSSKIRRINSNSIQVDTVSRNIQVIDSNSFECMNINLPKLHINKYSGNYSEWRILLKLNTHPVETDTLGTRFGIQSFSKDEGFDLSALLQFLHLEIRSRERASQINSHKLYHYSPPSQNRTKNKGSYFLGQRMKPPPNRVHFRPHSFPTPLEKVELRSRKCLYCNKGHELDTCRSFDAHEKREILRKKGCCFLCLSHGHRARECVTGESCPICNGSHHFSICFRNRHDDDLSPKRDTDNVISTVIKTEVNSVLLQTCAALIDVKNEQEVVRLFLDNGSQRSFVLKSTSEKFNFPILRKENLSICTFGAKETETKTLNIVKIKLKNRDDPNLCIEIEAVETEHISITNLPTPDRNIDKKFRYLKNVQLHDSYEFNDKEISILIGSDYYYQVVTGRITRLNKNLVTVETLFGWSLQGQSTDSEDLLTMSVIVNESNISKQLSEFWNLENLGIEAEVSDEENIDNDIMSEFEAGISYQNKRYKVKFPWKPNMKTLLENNEEVARKRFLKLRSRFKNDSSLFEDYKLVVNNYLSEKIIERVPFEEENLKHNIFYLPHRAVIRTDKTTSKLRIVFDASSHAKSQLSLNDCLHTGLNFIPNLFFLLIKFRVNPIAFVADIKMAFLMIEIDESERDFTRFFWDENPEIDLENKRLDIFE
ncbi:uncharacterized protein TNCV_1676851 [Trichonephila clavipes]|nr:uncharacterized protein TNCV_1676851 [Trichonephila clavipes]